MLRIITWHLHYKTLRRNDHCSRDAVPGFWSTFHHLTTRRPRVVEPAQSAAASRLTRLKTHRCPSEPTHRVQSGICTLPVRKLETGMVFQVATVQFENCETKNRNFPVMKIVKPRETPNLRNYVKIAKIAAELEKP